MLQYVHQLVTNCVCLVFDLGRVGLSLKIAAWCCWCEHWDWTKTVKNVDCKTKTMSWKLFITEGNWKVSDTSLLLITTSESSNIKYIQLMMIIINILTVTLYLYHQNPCLAAQHATKYDLIKQFKLETDHLITER